MTVQFANNAVSTLAAAIGSIDTTISLAAGDGALFPTLSTGDWFPVTVVDSNKNVEIMKCTAISGDVLTVVRGQEGTVRRAFAAGCSIGLRMTAAAIGELVSDILTNTSGIASLNSDLGNYMQRSQNLNDVIDVATARFNLGVGDNFGNTPTNITGDDLNTITNNGFYNGATLTNAPLNSTNWWYVIVARNYGAAGFVAQIAIGMNSVTQGQMYLRTQNTTWTAWQLLSGAAAAKALANAAEILSNNGTDVPTVDQIWAAAAEVTIPFAAIVTPDARTFLNAYIAITGDIKIANMVLPKPGQEGYFRLDCTAHGTDANLTLGNHWFMPGGVSANDMVLTKNQMHMLFYKVGGDLNYYGMLVKNWST